MPFEPRLIHTRITERVVPPQEVFESCNIFYVKKKKFYKEFLHNL